MLAALATLTCALLPPALTSPPDVPHHLERLQRAAAGPLALLHDGWPESGDAVLALAGTLDHHGITPSETERQRIVTLIDCRAALLSGGPAPADNAHCEATLVAVFLSLARHFGATRPLAPHTTLAVEQRLLDALTRWAAPDALLATLPPPNAAYERLLEALARYQRIRDAGGFVPVPGRLRRVRPGRSHADVSALRRRLAQEDPAVSEGEGEAADLWDEPLSDALRRARARYQLRVRRAARYLPDRRLLSALNVPVEARIAELTDALNRLRASALRDHPYVLFVNIPDYHGEVWSGPELLRRFRVVVGGAQGVPRRPRNATPRLTSRIHTVVFNPDWNVPRRIYETEMRGSADEWLAAAPEGETRSPDDFWRQRGYQLKGGDEPRRQWLRKPPGRGNPLGRVKLLFENRHAVYLHDTPARKLFNRRRRAFSHGCVRVHEPVPLAELLLQRDAGWSDADSEAVLAHYRTTPVKLERPVPIVIDYIPVRVADDGLVHFLSDVYALRQAAL